MLNSKIVAAIAVTTLLATACTAQESTTNYTPVTTKAVSCVHNHKTVATIAMKTNDNGVPGSFVVANKLKNQTIGLELKQNDGQVNNSARLQDGANTVYVEWNEFQTTIKITAVVHQHTIGGATLCSVALPAVTPKVAESAPRPRATA